jgi:hypothetical protein
MQETASPEWFTLDRKVVQSWIVVFWLLLAASLLVGLLKDASLGDRILWYGSAAVLSPAVIFVALSHCLDLEEERQAETGRELIGTSYRGLTVVA